jgi:hypothetical protein
MEIVALGIATTSCSEKGSSGSSGSSGSNGSNTSSAVSSAPVYTTSSKAAPTYQVPTTMSTKTAETTKAAESPKTSASNAQPTGYSYGGGSSSGGSSVQPDSSDSTSLCPEQNGKTFTDPTSKKTFTIDCAHDHLGGDMDMKLIFSGGLSACIATCASTSGCVDVSMSGAACYLKKSPGNVVGNLLVVSAKLIDSDSKADASPASSAGASTTTAAPVGAAEYKPAGKYGNGSNNSVNDDPNVVWVTVTEDVVVSVTQWSTVYARDAAPTPAPAERREVFAAPRHGHALAHVKRAHGGKA